MSVCRYGGQVEQILCTITFADDDMNMIIPSARRGRCLINCCTTSYASSYSSVNLFFFSMVGDDVLINLQCCL